MHTCQGAENSPGPADSHSLKQRCRRSGQVFTWCCPSFYLHGLAPAVAPVCEQESFSVFHRPERAQKLGPHKRWYGADPTTWKDTWWLPITSLCGFKTWSWGHLSPQPSCPLLLLSHTAQSDLPRLTSWCSDTAQKSNGLRSGSLAGGEDSAP